MLDLLADLAHVTPDGVVLVAYLLDDAPSDLGEVAGLLSLAFTAAARQPVFAVDVVDARDGSTTGFTRQPSRSLSRSRKARGVRTAMSL